MYGSTTARWTLAFFLTVAMLQPPDALSPATRASDKPAGPPAVPARFQRLLDNLLQRRDLSDDQFCELIYVAAVSRLPSSKEKEFAGVIVRFYRPAVKPSRDLPEATRQAMAADIQNEARRKAYSCLLPMLLDSPESVLRARKDADKK
jgi:hypothetical protein